MGEGPPKGESSLSHATPPLPPTVPEPSSLPPNLTPVSRPPDDAMEGWALVQGKRGKWKARASLLSTDAEVPRKPRKGGTDVKPSALPTGACHPLLLAGENVAAWEGSTVPPLESLPSKAPDELLLPRYHPEPLLLGAEVKVSWYGPVLCTGKSQCTILGRLPQVSDLKGLGLPAAAGALGPKIATRAPLPEPPVGRYHTGQLFITQQEKLMHGDCSALFSGFYITIGSMDLSSVVCKCRSTVQGKNSSHLPYAGSESGESQQAAVTPAQN
ncbi:hypothetical protein UY3_11247 [Chelonia mydas]|uniref:Uncharacterized protein n=1 Tax=Chelonia mydas TaxID=8469 RepID=M7BU00_CHEMY|nr:hypothetical protein UY3_11247 [Chelonia mydas]